MATVTRKPHDGRMILGGKGSVIPFKRNTPNAEPAAESDNTSDIDALFTNMTKVQQYPMAPDHPPPED